MKLDKVTLHFNDGLIIECDTIVSNNIVHEPRELIEDENGSDIIVTFETIIEFISSKTMKTISTNETR